MVGLQPRHIFYSVAEVLVFLISWFDVTLPSDQNPIHRSLAWTSPAKSELADTYGSGTVLRYCIYHTLGAPANSNDFYTQAHLRRRTSTPRAPPKDDTPPKTWPLNPLQRPPTCVTAPVQQLPHTVGHVNLHAGLIYFFFALGSSKQRCVLSIADLCLRTKQHCCVCVPPSGRILSWPPQAHT